MNYNETRRTLTARPKPGAIEMAMRFNNISTKAELARAAGVSKGTAGNLLNATRDTFNPETAAKIAKGLRVPTDTLFTLEALHVPVTRTAA